MGASALYFIYFEEAFYGNAHLIFGRMHIMKQKTRLQGLDSKLLIEAIIRSALWGITVGAVAAFAAAIVCWFFEAALLWVAILTFIVAGAAGGAIFYFGKFRPSVAANAKRIDRLGLDERAITMVELSGDDSLIARKQREDALASISKIKPNQIHVKLSTTVIILCSVFTLLFAGMGTVEVLSSKGVLPSGVEIWQKLFPPEPLPKYTLTYSAAKGGELIGETEQTVEQGSSGEMVIAVADEGFVFLGWSDGVATPYRVDEDVKRNVKVEARFAMMDAFKDPGDDNDKPDDVPGGDGDQETNNPDAPPSGGEKYIEINQIIDGQTYYRDVIDDYYQRAMEYLENDENVPDHIRRIIERYYSTIQ